jgi:hypothetical protein
MDFEHLGSHTYGEDCFFFVNHLKPLSFRLREEPLFLPTLFIAGFLTSVRVVQGMGLAEEQLAQEEAAPTTPIAITRSIRN